MLDNGVVKATGFRVQNIPRETDKGEFEALLVFLFQNFDT
jgi:hypothetical protein